MKNQIIHNMTINVENNTFTVTPMLDIHQGDINSHILLINFKNNYNKSISINKDVTYKIYFYRSFDKKLIESSDVCVKNYYRGILSHVLGNTIMNTFGEYTCTLRGYLNDDIISSVSFPINIAKAHDYTTESSEIAMTKDFYNTLNKHMSNMDIHLSETDRESMNHLNEINELMDQLINLINDYSSWIQYNGCDNEDCTHNPCHCLEYLINLPIGKIKLNKSVRLRDYKDIYRTIVSPAYIIHTDTISEDNDSTDVTHEHKLLIFTKDNIIHYTEVDKPDGTKSGKWIAFSELVTSEQITDMMNQLHTEITNELNNILTEAKAYTDTKILDNQNKIDKLNDKVNSIQSDVNLINEHITWGDLPSTQDNIE